ncbi:hypothetical protein GCM10023093_06990 [Nemorincola caseinilytica]|uniref:Secretion system C-terminal sorting domain-containing protein n=2 Tax=Nemorincola caseinilytica TaxID=2054315 RepID=A0ABP8N9Y3_9BACT
MSGAAYAQEYYQYDTTVKVYAYDKKLNIPWCGGFNAPEFANADLNHDGVQDMVVYERGQGIYTFINTGYVSGLPVYRFDPKYALTFPAVRGYLYMLDYNCDGIADLFHRGDDGIAVYKGFYNASDQLCFTFYQSLFYTNDATAGGPSNAYVNPGDIPGIADVDGDGDIDFVSYYITGGYMYYHRNMRVEDGLPCDSIRIKLVDRCWGKVAQNFDRAHQLQYSCSNAGLLRAAGSGTSRKKTHPGNTTCLLDWDMDGDIDYLDGNASFNELTFLQNGKLDHSYAIDSFVKQDTLWPTGGKRVDIRTWPAPFNVLVDDDNKKDLLVSPNSGTGSENYKCIWYYKNNTVFGAPDWQFKSDTFLVDQTIDLGSGTYPMLFDYDMDGKLDLLVGSDGYRQPSGLLRSSLSYYKNTSTPGNASFTLQTKDLAGMYAHNFQGIAPTAGDMDNDGKADLIVGHTNGKLSFFRNMASNASVAPDWQLQQLEMTDEDGNIINLDGNAAPFIYDVDKDGKKDLVIGSIYGYLQYYQNKTLIPGTLKLKLVNKRLGGAKADPTQTFGIYSTPFIGKIDPTGEEYLLMGSNSGSIYRFSGIASGDTTLAYTQLDAEYAFIDSTYNLYQRPMYSMYTDRRTSLTVGDIDGSGSYVLIKGNIRGGLEIYKRKVYTAEPPVYTDKVKVNVYPNPADNALNITWDGINDTEVRTLHASIIDITGRLCMERTAPTAYGLTQFSITHLPQGVYVCIVRAGNSRYYSKFTIVR